MKKQKMWILLSLLILFISVGCNVASDMETDSTITPEATSAENTAVPLPTSTTNIRDIRLTPAATPQVEIVPPDVGTAVMGEVPEEMMTAVYQDLITTENVAQEEIAVVRAESIIWNDGSLGCPQPGEVYPQATVAGYWIVLAANGRTYNYHAAETGYFILCQNNLLIPPAQGTPSS